MKLSTKKLPKSKLELRFELNPEELEKFRERAILDLAKDIEIKGFRRGSAPRDVVEREVGQNRILAEAVDLAVNKTYRETITGNNIEAIGQPEVKISKVVSGGPLEFSAIAQVMPEIKLPDYKKIASGTERREVKLEENEVAAALKWLQKSRAKFSQVNRPCKKGDFVEIEFSNSIDGKNYKDAFVLGEGKFVPGFEDNVEGMSAGEHKEFSLGLPQDYSKKQLAGKEISFKVKLNSVQEMELPELTDDFAKSLGAFDNLSSLKESVRVGLLQEKKDAERQRVHTEILEKVAAGTDCEIPDILLRSELDREMALLQKEVVDKLKLSFEEYLSKLGQSREDLEKELKPRANSRVKNQLVLRDIARREDIKVGVEEIREEADRFLKRYSRADQAGRAIDPEKLKLYIEDVIRTEKVLAKLESYATNN